ncbi:MAG: class I SAM-dependent methyltransferase [Verrucomicrobiales bacterium]|jgi:SAM-dependent methyltransferase|nr:class I SAM-dependent methyltransferase [Verrucomicrobiales bacterium]
MNNTSNPSASAIPYTSADILEILSRARHYNNWQVRQILRFFPPETPLADFGAGIGTFAKILREHGREIICVEPDDTLREQLHRDGLTVSAGLGACADGSLPAVYTLNVLEHIERDEDALAEIFAKLQPGGKLLVYVPALPVLWTSIDDKARHFRRYRRRELRDKLRRAGFAIINARYADSLGALAALAHRWFLDRGDGTVSSAAVRVFDRYIFPPSVVCDLVCRFIFGKNLLATAVKPAGRR